MSLLRECDICGTVIKKYAKYSDENRWPKNSLQITKKINSMYYRINCYFEKDIDLKSPQYINSIDICDNCAMGILKKMLE